jgi:hypothetical protein
MPKFYQTPRGTLSTSLNKWKDDMRAEGLDPKDHKGRNAFEVPTKAADLMEFLTFHAVNVVNPRPVAVAPEVAGGGSPPPPTPPPATPTTMPGDLDELFEAAPLARQLHLAALACENARKSIR